MLHNPVPSPDASRISGDNSARSANPKKDDAVAYIWKTLQDETGFASFRAYTHHRIPTLVTERTKQRSWEEIEARLQGKPESSYDFAVVDISTEEALPSKASLRCESLTATQAFTALRDPPRDVAVQVVLWSIPLVRIPDLVLCVDVLGLGIKLEPWFFDALESHSGRYRGGKSEAYEIWPTYLQTTGNIVAIGNLHAVPTTEIPPVVLIAGGLWVDQHTRDRVLWSFLRDAPAHPTPANFHRLAISQSGDNEAKLYTQMLSHVFQQSQGSASACADLVVGSLLPLMRLENFRIKGQAHRVRTHFKTLLSSSWAGLNEAGVKRLGMRNDDEMLVYGYRDMLRSLIEQIENETELYKEFMSLKIRADSTKNAPFLLLMEERSRTLQQTRRLEAEIRDYLQLQTGQMALVESRKSIELSNYQIREGKRVKIFTILAFVYVPLNLATSVFGMNLQQLNGNGKNFQDFISTAVVALVVTGGTWWLMEQVNTALAWLKRPPGEEPIFETIAQEPAPKPTYTIAERLAMLGWLIRNGHTKWMFRTGAGKHLLINSQRIYVPAAPTADWRIETTLYGSPYVEKSQVSARLCAGHYVSQFARINMRGADPFGIGKGGWNRASEDWSARLVGWIYRFLDWVSRTMTGSSYHRNPTGVS